MPIRCRTLRSFLEYWVFSATERLFPSKGALESYSRTGPDWIAPERRDYRNVAQVAFGLKIPHSDKTSCALGAPPSMKLGSAPYRAVNRLFSVGVEVIFIAGLMRPRRTTWNENRVYAAGSGPVCGKSIVRRLLGGRFLCGDKDPA